MTTEDYRIAAERQRHRDKYTAALYAAYPDATDPVREQAEMMMDRWWPGTYAKPKNELPPAMGEAPLPPKDYDEDVFG